MKLKIYGERNTGTQFMRDILLANGQQDLWPGTIAELGEWDRVAASDQEDRPAADLILLREALIDDVFREAYDRTLGWKHGAPDLARLRSAGASTRFVITVKNPYAWVASMYRRPHHNLLTGNLASVEAFVTSAWIACERDNIRRHVASVVELWNVKYRAWVTLGQAVPTQVIRYEDLLLDPGALVGLAEALDREPHARWRLPERVRNNAGDLAAYTSFYACERWRHALSPACIDLISARLDADLVTRLGYRMLS